MRCQDVRERLAERLDAELDDSQALVVDRHVSSCPACARVAASLESVVADLSAFGRAEAPDGMASRLLARVPPPGRLDAPAAPRVMRFATKRHELVRVAAAAAVMVVLSLAVVGRGAVGGGLAGRVADGVAPLVAEARQQVVRARASGEGPLARLDSRAERGFERLTGRP